MFDICRNCYDLGYTDEAYTPCPKCTRGQAVAAVNAALDRLDPASLAVVQLVREACVVCGRRLPKTDRAVQLPDGRRVGAHPSGCGQNGVRNELLHE